MISYYSIREDQNGSGGDRHLDHHTLHLAAYHKATIAPAALSILDDNCCGAFDRTSLARRSRKKWRRLSVLEWNRSYAAYSTSYDLHHKTITGLVGSIEKR
uniref:Uncharacterized protein n=1 Tax=Heterorhabditis bacteriophora TaxID=37862 RepID=A0A1I7W8H6_HETBA